MVDRYFEAKICCLIECKFWNEALKELKWFEMDITKIIFKILLLENPIFQLNNPYKKELQRY